MLAIALALDALLGEPQALWRRFPHPVVLMGQLVGHLERKFNRGDWRQLKGAGALTALLGVVGVIAWLLAALPDAGVLEAVGAAILLAQRSLIDHVRDVARGLRVSLEEGRSRVAMIVGRDPEQLDEGGVGRAAIESAAENFSDGLIAPAFWFAVAGLPGIAIYKAINTADSMIGHRTERYAAFGWAAARLDDLVNFVPARLAGALICGAGSGRSAFRVMCRDARHHRSPNAGWPEAAMAASLGVSLAGPRAYGGVMTDDAPIHPEGRRAVTAGDIDGACVLLWRSWWLVFAAAVVLALLG